MGVCCGAAESKPKSRGHTQNRPTHLAKADPNSSQQIDVKDIDSRVKVLQRGIEPELEHMVNTYDEDINAYVFGQNMTLLLQAVVKCPNAKVVDMIMKKGADVDKAEIQTGNTAIFLSALDLKVDFVPSATLIKNIGQLVDVKNPNCDTKVTDVECIQDLMKDIGNRLNEIMDKNS